MKLLIDIPDKDYEKLKDGHIPFSILDVIQNGTPIPDNATNEDVFKTVFSDSTSEDDYKWLSRDWRSWWNAPYQKGGKR